jgi:glycosyltransferase involved in cell wall biosynthesis
MKKKIHIWCPNFRTFGGGIGSFTKQLYVSLDKKKNIISVISKNDLMLDLDKNQNVIIFQLIKFFKLIVFVSRIILKFFTQKPELIITTHINFSVFAYLAKILFKIQYIVVAHGLEINSRISKFQLIALNNSEKIISVSRWTQNRLLQLGININKIVIIGNTASEKIFHPKYSTKNLRYFYKIKSNEKIILTVSRLDKMEKHKGYDLIIKAMEKLTKKFKNIRYLIVGGGDDQKRIKILIKKLKLEKSILLCGFVPDNKLPYYYCLADVFALPSTGEGFGIVFLESMLSGTPVVGGNKDGSIDALNNGHLGLLVKPKNIQSITLGLIKILKKSGPKFWFSPKKLRKACLKIHSRDVFEKKINYQINNI